MSDSGRTTLEGDLIEAKAMAFGAGTLALLCGLTFLFGIFREIYEWLRYGEVDKWLVVDVIRMPQFEWIGLQRIVEFIWTTQVFVAALVGLLVMGWLYGHYHSEIDRIDSKISSKGSAQS